MPPQQIIQPTIATQPAILPFFRSINWWYLISLLLPPVGLLLLMYLVFKKIKGFSTDKKTVGIIILATIVGAIIYLVLYTLFFSTQLNRYHYRQLENYKLTSKLSGASMTFDKPVELKKYFEHTILGSTVVDFVHSQTKDSKKYSTSFLAASSYQSALATNSDYLQQLGKVLTNKSDKDYKTVTEPLVKFVQTYTPSNLTIKMGDFSAKSTKGITKNIWQADYRAGETAGKSADLKGRFVFAAGERSFYLFMISTTDYNWNNNANLFQQLIDSVKIDQ